MPRAKYARLPRNGKLSRDSRANIAQATDRQHEDIKFLGNHESSSSPGTYTQQIRRQTFRGYNLDSVQHFDLEKEIENTLRYRRAEIKTRKDPPVVVETSAMERGQGVSVHNENQCKPKASKFGSRFSCFGEKNQTKGNKEQSSGPNPVYKGAGVDTAYSDTDSETLFPIRNKKRGTVYSGTKDSRFYINAVGNLFMRKIRRLYNH